MRHIVTMFLMMLLLIGVANAVGIAYNTGADDNTIEAQPGETRAFELNPQNGGADLEIVNITVNAEKGSIYFDDCKCTSKVLNLSAKETTRREPLSIFVPEDLPRNSTYKIHFSIKNEPKEAGMIQLSTVNSGYFFVRIAPLPPVKEPSNINWPLVLGGSFAGILLLLGGYYWFIHRKKESHQRSSHE